MKKNIFRKHIQIILVSVLLVSCSTTMDLEDRLDKLLTGQTMVLPIGKDTVTLDDLLATFDSAKYIGTSNNDIFVKYRDTLKWALPKLDLLENALYEDEQVLAFSPMPPFVSGNQNINLIYKLPIDFSGTKGIVSIDRAEILSAKLEIMITVENITNLLPSDITISAHFPRSHFEFNNSTDSIFTHQPTAFNGYQTARDFGSFKISALKGISNIPIKVQFKVNLGSKTVSLQPSSKIKISYKLTNVETKAFYGTFAPEDLFGTKEEVYDASDLVKDIPENGIFKLSEPQLNIHLINHSGVGFDLVLDSLKAFKGNDTSFQPIYALFNGQKQTTKSVNRKLNYADIAPKTTIKLDYTNENGSISRFFEKFPLPDQIYYKLRMKSNYKTGDPMEFFTPTDNLEGQIDIKIPLKLNTGSIYTFQDTIRNVDMTFLDENRLDTVCIAFKVVNKFPVKGKLSISFLDGNLKPFDNIVQLTDSTIAAPKINELGEVEIDGSTTSYIVAKATKNQISQLTQVKNIAYTLVFESEKDKKITFRKENSLSLTLGLLLNGENLFNF